MAKKRAPARRARKPDATFKIGHGALDLARAAKKRPTALSPFTLPQHPPGVGPSSKIAQDEAICGPVGAFTWAASNYIASAYAEGQAFLGLTELSVLAQRPEYRVMSEVTATEMTRKWIALQATGDVDKTERIKELDAELKRLGVQKAFRKLAMLDGLMGRAHLYIDTGDTDNPDELKTPIGSGRDATSRSKVGKGSLKRLQVVEPVWCYPTSYNSNDPLKEDWYAPQYWFAMSRQIHKTRLLTFVGREVPDLLKPAYSFGGLSMTQMAKPYVDNWLRTRQSVSDIVHSFVVWVLRTNLTVTSQGDGSELFKRLDLFNLLRDNKGVMATDKDTEEFSNVSAPLGTLDHLQAQAQEQMCSVSRIPVVKFTGIQPSGLNADSEGVIRTFYDTIHAQQELLFTDHLKTVIDFAMLSLWGEFDPEITFVYEPLWALDEKAKAEVRKTEADTGSVLIDSGVISPEEDRKRVASDPDTPYQGLDIEDVPDLHEEEEEGLAPRGGGGAISAELDQPGQGEERKAA